MTDINIETQTATIHVLKVDGRKVPAAMAKQLHRRDIVEVFGIQCGSSQVPTYAVEYQGISAEKWLQREEGS